MQACRYFRAKEMVRIAVLHVCYIYIFIFIFIFIFVCKVI